MGLVVGEEEQFGEQQKARQRVRVRHPAVTLERLLCAGTDGCIAREARRRCACAMKISATSTTMVTQ